MASFRFVDFIALNCGNRKSCMFVIWTASFRCVDGYYGSESVYCFQSKKKEKKREREREEIMTK